MSAASPLLTRFIGSARRLVRLLALCGLLALCASPASAAPVRMWTEVDRSEFGVVDGDAYLWLYDSVVAYLVNDDSSYAELDSLDVYLEWQGRQIARASDPVTGQTRYEFGAGRMTLEFTWLDPVLGTQTGAFRGRVNPFDFVLVDADPYGPQVDGPVGSGRLDENLARLLGVGRRADVTSFQFLMDDVFGAPGDTWWSQGGCCQYVDLAFSPASVPEPGLVWAFAGGMWLAARRRRR